MNDFRGRSGLYICLLILFTILACQKEDRTIPPDSVLIFHKTAGYRHASIEKGIDAIRPVIENKGLRAVITRDASIFRDDSLSRFAAIIFLSTTGDILDDGQQAAMERYIQSGGGFIGIHAAADTEYKWSWYNGLVGGYFESHPNNPNVRTATVTRTENELAAVSQYPATFSRTDEWYNYRDLYNGIIPLLQLDESSYEGGTMNGDHPITWYHAYDGGRAFYTGFGHTEESFEEQAFLGMIDGALDYAANTGGLNYSLASTAPRPDNDRFSREVFAFNLNEPTELAVLPDDRVLFTERKGAVKLYKPDLDTVLTIAQLDVYTRQEDGLMGLAIDPDFENNRYVYMYYSPAGETPEQYLSRFEMDDDRLLLYTEKVILKVPTQREECCHTGGSIAFGPDGNLFVSTGDDTNPFASDGYGPLDEREGRKYWDGQRAPGNTNDLRGKILRITVQADGTYTIPEGNLFPPGTEGTRPEIYVMGCRNPYRIHVDRKTGVLYWGDVGPDAAENDSLRGPRGYDEVNRAAAPGFYGWPYFIGENYPYRDYNFAKVQSGDFYDPEHPINDSPNNTGLRELPPANPPLIWYPYSYYEKFPLAGNGSRNAMAGYVYYHDLFEQSEGTFPAYYDGKLLAYDWMRGWILAVTMDESGKLLSLEPFLPHIQFSNLIDMDFSRTGVLYTLEYGTGWFQQNTNARLSRINYNAGNRPPYVKLATSETTGKVPLEVRFDASESYDPDGNEVNVEWFVGRKKVGEGDSLNYTFDTPGYFFVNAVVDDGKDQSVQHLIVRPGNEPPDVEIVVQGNSSFYFGDALLSYEVHVEDEEDGSTGDGTIMPRQVSISEDFLQEGYDMTEIAQGHQLPSPVVIGKNTMEQLDCKACHQINAASAGPSYTRVAEKYYNDPEAIEYLAGKIISGGGGVWGEQPMAAHPDLEPVEAANIVRYILSLHNTGIGSESGSSSLGGVLRTNKHDRENRNALYLITASYTDSGNEYGGLTGSAQLILRNPRVQAENYSASMETAQYADWTGNGMINNITILSFLRYDQIDLTGVGSAVLKINATEACRVVLRKDSPTGAELGAVNISETGEQLAEVVFSNDSGNIGSLYLTFESESENVPMLELDWIEFKQ